MSAIAIAQPHPSAVNSPAPFEAARLLAELSPGQTGAVCEVGGPAADADRLKALGVCSGRRVSVVAGGNPMIVKVLGSRIGLSRDLAGLVTIRTC